MNAIILDAAIAAVRRAGGFPTTIYAGAKQLAAWTEWKRVALAMRHMPFPVDPNGTETYDGLEIVPVGKYDYFEVASMGFVTAMRQLEALTTARKDLAAEQADHEITRAALAQALQDIEALAAGQSDLIDLLMGAMAAGECLPESLREQIANLFKSAVVVEAVEGKPNYLTTRPLSGEPDPEPM